MMRYHEGEVIASMAYNWKGIVDARHVELIIIWNGIILSEEFHIFNFIMKLNCSSIVRRMEDHSRKGRLISFGALVETLQEKFTSNNSYHIRYINGYLNISIL